MKTHEVKSWPKSFQPIKSGAKRADIRRDDRGYKVGDILIHREWLPEQKSYTGESIRTLITHILRGPDFGVPEGHVVMSIQTLEVAENEEAGVRAVGGLCTSKGLSKDERVFHCNLAIGHGGVHAYREAGRTIARWGENHHAVYFRPEQG